MMYEKYVRQALPDREYRELLGSAVCVFNSNNAFIINNILKDPNVQTNWYQLIDKESGEIKTFLQKRLKNEGKLGEEILALFEDVVNMRNRIIHSFRITDENDNQILATKEKESKGVEGFKLIFTKLDETTCFGNILNLKLYTDADLSYLTCGQNVPDDIEKLDAQRIVKQLLGG